MSWKWLIAVALSPMICFPQEFTNLRGTSEGSLFFLTRSQPMDLGLSSAPRIYVLDNAGVRLFPGTEGAQGFDISADGGVLVLYRANESIVLNAGGAEHMRLEGRAQVSPNGRFLALDSGSSVSLIDVLSKQTIRTVEDMRLLPGKAVSSTGAIAALDAGRQIQIIRRDSTSPAGLPAILGNQPNALLHVDDSGRSIAAYLNGFLYIKVLSAATTLQFPVSAHAILRFDTRALQFLSNIGIQSLSFDGGPMETVIAQTGLTVAALAGPDRYFYVRGNVLTSHYARSVPIDLFQSVSVSSPPEAFPGTIVEWRIPLQSNWTNLNAAPPYPTSLNGYSVLLDGRPAPIVALTTTVSLSQFRTSWHTIRFLVPWSLPLTGDITAVNLVLGNRSGIIFSSTPVRLFVRKWNPRFERTNRISPLTTQSYARAFHAATTEVTPASPATMDELITVRMRGLGPLTSLPPDDRPPTTSIPIASKLECIVADGIDSRPLTLESAALSAAESGTYDIAFRIPAMNPRGELHISCELAGVGDSTAIPARNRQ